MTARTDLDLIGNWVERDFGFAFADPRKAMIALTHRSASGDHNERLEFLGDAVLNCAVARLLFDAFPDADEGDLSRLRATLVSGESLAQVASDLNLGDFLRLGSGELKSGGFRRASILADALEALFGAIYLEGGFDAAAAAVRRIIEPRMNRLPTADTLKDPKTRLQETLQARGLSLPIYALQSVEGAAHAQTFAVSCDVAELGLASDGDGASRRRAEQMAAERMLNLLPIELRKQA